MRLTFVSTNGELATTITLLVILCSIAGRSIAATAPSLGTTSFNNAFPGLTVLVNAQPSPQTATNVGTLVATGWDFTATAPTDNVSISAQAGGPTNVASDLYIRLNRQTPGKTLTAGTVKSNDGSPFSLQSFYIRIGASAAANIVITGYRSGVAVTGATTTIALSNNVWTLVNLSTVLSGGLPAFRSVDEFRATQAGSTTAQIGNFSIDAITIATALPLVLTNFSGQSEGNYIQLDWVTASEENTSYFEVQRSTDGADYTAVVHLPAAGNSSLALHYSYPDPLPAVKDPIYFYRLKMADLDGRFTYSQVLKIDGPPLTLRLSIYPNPFRQQVTITVESPLADRAVITVTDLSGRRLLEQVSPLQKGSNILPLSSLSQLGKGMYLFTIATSHQKQTVPLIKTQ